MLYASFKKLLIRDWLFHIKNDDDVNVPRGCARLHVHTSIPGHTKNNDFYKKKRVTL